MPDNNDDKTDKAPAKGATDKAPAKGATDKAPAKGAVAKDDGDEEGARTKRPKRPTGNFVAVTPVEYWDPSAKKGSGGRRTVTVGETLPKSFSEAQLAKLQDAGHIDHEYV